jgi:hypothetical protein
VKRTPQYFVVLLDDEKGSPRGTTRCGGHQDRRQTLAGDLPAHQLGALARYSRDRSFEALRANTRFVFAVASGSITREAS